MTQFNINSIIENYNLDIEELAKVLFPDAKYPKLAFTRILKGESSLSVDQLEKLAAHIGIMPSELFMLDTWANASGNGLLAFKKGRFTAKLNHGNTFLSVYEDNKVITTGFIDSGISIDDFTKYLDNIITKYQQENGTN